MNTKVPVSLSEGPYVADRSDRSVLEVTGRDRASWLHNFTTNQVKNLQPGEGNYAFVLNNQGRILFDLNLIVRKESIWLDLDSRFKEAALRHFAKYVIVEDVRFVDRSDDINRFACIGQRCADVFESYRLSGLNVLPILNSRDFTWQGQELLFVRTDYCGARSWDCFVPRSPTEFTASIQRASLEWKIGAADADRVNRHRIEAGIPWPVTEINSEYLPAETGQLERAVSFQKGCYLGQEVVERMRSRGALARRLVGLRLAGTEVPSLPAELVTEEGKMAGTMTSACASLLGSEILGLGFVKSALANPGQVLKTQGADRTQSVTVGALPQFTSSDG